MTLYRFYFPFLPRACGCIEKEAPIRNIQFLKPLYWVHTVSNSAAGPLYCPLSIFVIWGASINTIVLHVVNNCLPTCQSETSHKMFLLESTNRFLLFHVVSFSRVQTSKLFSSKLCNDHCSVHQTFDSTVVWCVLLHSSLNFQYFSKCLIQNS